MLTKLRGWVRAHVGASIAIVVVGVALLGFGLYWFSPQSALVQRRVDEALPGAIASPQPEVTASPSPDAVSPEPTTDPEPAEPTTKVVAEGDFHGIEHETTGTAKLVKLGDGSYVLRLEDLETLNGPDLRVYLSAEPADGDPGALDDSFVDLGGLKGNLGNQNYEIPAKVDIGDYASAVVWCRRFSVGFGAAPLDAA